jgi:hypothetical protein
VVQELMRHASSRCTVEIYSQANAIAKREAQHHVVAMLLPEVGDGEIPEVLGDAEASS